MLQLWNECSGRSRRSPQTAPGQAEYQGHQPGHRRPGEVNDQISFLAGDSPGLEGAGKR